MSRNGQKPTSLMTSLTKKNNSKYIFFIANKKPQGFEQLSSAVGRGAMQLLRQLQTACLKYDTFVPQQQRF